jgi:peptide/nickel transport system permease protein
VSAAASERGAVAGRIAADPMGLAGFVIVAAMVFTALFATWLAPYAPAQIAIDARLEAPGWAHLLGTDQLGRDVFSRVIVGTRIAMEVALFSVAVSIIGGAVLGLLAGYGPKRLDAALLLLFDAVRSFPTIMLGLALVTVLGPGFETIILVVVLTFIPGYARIVRTQTMALKYTDFVLAERTLGAGMARVLAVHVLPNVIGPLLILASMDIPVVITVESGMSFLGLGVRPPTPSWGTILNDGYAYIRNTPWVIIGGGLPIIIGTIGFTLLGEALRDAFDPKLQGRDG